MKQILIQKGKVVVENVPAPMVSHGAVLVRVSHSCVSIGTELAGMRTSGRPLWRRALRQPDKVIKTLKMAASHGVVQTRNIVRTQLNGSIPVGYSAAGEVIDVGAGVADIVIGDRVACAGAQCAHHAEVISVPRNLVVPVPDGVSYPEASTVTLGAIAMQGLRRAEPTLGETFVVIGLGALGQLTTQLLSANGCKVIGMDVDAGRVKMACELGLDIGITSGSAHDERDVIRLSGGNGVDGVIVTAATSSDGLISTAFQMCRKKGRVVLVGDVGLNINRGDIYLKELDFLVSTSYGPGRYDRAYEEEGLDYPISHVRWTENRNLEEFLHLIARGLVRVQPMITAFCRIEDAPPLYQRLQDGTDSPLFALIEYPFELRARAVERVIPRSPAIAAPQPGLVSIAVVGAGNYSQGMHLPLLASLPKVFHLRAIVTRTGHKAAEVAERFSADYSSTDYSEVLRDDTVDAILLATRHNLHASQVCEAIAAGKHVLVEKPLALTPQELDEVRCCIETNAAASLVMTGFNRNFSPLVGRIQEIIVSKRGPMIIQYRMNAGYVPADSWIHDVVEGGGRNIGEACHIYALFSLLIAARITRVSVQSLRPQGSYYQRNDNFVATIGFVDGSVATLTYTALGSGELPKEHMEIFIDGIALVLDDYQELSVYGSDAKGMSLKTPDKGQEAQLIRFAKALQSGKDLPIPLWQQMEAMHVAFEVERGILAGESASEANNGNK